jgi:hypothetical protein
MYVLCCNHILLWKDSPQLNVAMRHMFLEAADLYLNENLYYNSAIKFLFPFGWNYFNWMIVQLLYASSLVNQK